MAESGDIVNGWALAGWSAVGAGHVILCVALFNRLHATAVDYRRIKLLEVPLAGWFLAVPALAYVWRVPLGQLWGYRIHSAPLDLIGWLLVGYLLVCLVVFAKGAFDWLGRRMRVPPPALLEEHSERVDVAAFLGRPLAGNTIGRWCAMLPGNQSFQLEITRKVLALPRLPEPLEGLTIAHLSDLHFTGRIAREYFEYQIERVNELRADLIAVTGDILDCWECRSWLPDTLGRLRAEHGVYFLLGNHDLRPGDPRELRAILESLGLIDVGNRVVERVARGTSLRIVGNELPWFGPAPHYEWPTSAIDEDAATSFDLLLSHAPDQFGWAIQRRFPLMLAGHTHGGQIVVPLLGPVVAPSRHGVRYAAGVFESQGTVMHVSRGMSGEEPLRWNCPPEVALLRLTRGRK